MPNNYQGLLGDNPFSQYMSQAMNRAGMNPMQQRGFGGGNPYGQMGGQFGQMGRNQPTPFRSPFGGGMQQGGNPFGGQNQQMISPFAGVPPEMNISGQNGQGSGDAWRGWSGDTMPQIQSQQSSPLPQLPQGGMPSQSLSAMPGMGPTMGVTGLGQLGKVDNGGQEFGPFPSGVSLTMNQVPQMNQQQQALFNGSQQQRNAGMASQQQDLARLMGGLSQMGGMMPSYGQTSIIRQTPYGLAI